MKWPKKVEIGGLRFKIYYVHPGDRDDKPTSKGLSHGESGAIVQSNREIYIDKGLEPEVKLLVLLHELVHGIGDAIKPNGLPFKNEVYTNTFSNMLLQALKSMEVLDEEFKD